MNVTCPACRAVNTDGPNCRRCKADLSLIFALEKRREWLLAQAHSQLQAGHFSMALSTAREAEQLRPGSDSTRIYAVARLMSADAMGALATWMRERKAVSRGQ